MHSSLSAGACCLRLPASASLPALLVYPACCMCEPGVYQPNNYIFATFCPVWCSLALSQSLQAALLNLTGLHPENLTMTGALVGFAIGNEANCAFVLLVVFPGVEGRAQKSATR